MSDDTFGQSWEAFCDSSDSSYERDVCREPSHGHARRESFCTSAYHELLKADNELWSQQHQLPSMTVDAETIDGESYPGYELQLVNCVRCHSTLAREKP